MSKKLKFTGKIRDNPIVALERGNREVMDALWKEYFTELVEMDPKSGRFRELAARIKAEAHFDRLYQEWDNLPVSERAFRWYQLLEISKKHKRNTEGLCVRCGECCQRYSPTLLQVDMPLFQENILGWMDVYTLRKGEMVTSPRTGDRFALAEERLKLRKRPGTRQCKFYQAEPSLCLIYERRPQQCRDQACWLQEKKFQSLSGPPPQPAGPVW